MIDLTQEQIDNVVQNIGALADKNLSYEGFKSKVQEMNINGSDQDLKAFKNQLQEVVSKRNELSKLSDDELNEAVGGVGLRTNCTISGISSDSIATIIYSSYKLHKKSNKKDDKYNELLGLDYSLDNTTTNSNTPKGGKK